MTERRVLLASLLSVVCISLYSQVLMKNARGVARPPVSPATVQTTLAAAPMDFMELPDETTTPIESESLRIEIGNNSGAIRSVALNQFLNTTKTAPLQFKARTALFSLRGDKEPFKATAVQVMGSRAEINLSNGSDQIKIAYELDPKIPVLRVSLLEPGTDQKPVSFSASWIRGDDLSSQQNRLEAYVIEQKPDKPKYHHFAGSWKGEKNVPRGTLLALSERHFCLVLKTATAWESVKLYAYNNHGLGAKIPVVQLNEPVSLYFGARDFFQLRAAGFAQAFPIGALGQIGLALLSLLNWLAGFTHSYGIAIILFSVIVTGAMSPFTFLSYRSMKRMQELKPQIDKITAQHKNDPQKANKEVFALYKENKVSPLGGCLPMLLQMPIFIALFQAMSHFVNLRGATFFGIKDLSLPDQLIHLSFKAPLIGTGLNVLPIIMAAAMYLQTRASQKSMGSPADNPTAQMMSGPMMPILFLFMFYQFPAGLVLYWLTNSIMSMLLSRVASK